MQCPQYVYTAILARWQLVARISTYQRVARMTNDMKFRNASLDFMLVKAVAECPELAHPGRGATSGLSLLRVTRCVMPIELSDDPVLFACA